jgi:multicomponent Na+:H+ antiporter subunit F
MMAFLNPSFLEPASVSPLKAPFHPEARPRVPDNLFGGPSMFTGMEEVWLYETVRVAFAVMMVALGLVFVRLVKGPTVADRVVALDMIAFLAIGIGALYALVTAQRAFLDAALVLALVAFLATAAFARYLKETLTGEVHP